MSPSRILAMTALLAKILIAANITVVDPNSIIQLDGVVHNKTDLCNALKLKDLSDISVTYVVEKVDESNIDFFNMKVKEASDDGFDLHLKQFIVKSCNMDDTSFLLCLKTIESKKLSIIDSDKAKIEQIFDPSPKNSIILFEDATSNNFTFEARVLAEEDKDATLNAHTNAEAKSDPIDPHNDIELSEEERAAKDNAAKAAAADQVNINIRPEGVMGVGLAIAFILILIVYFGLMMNSADFNPKFIKEKLPQGKEY